MSRVPTKSSASSSLDQQTDSSAQPCGAHRQHPRKKWAVDVAVVYRRIDELRLDPENPRLHSARQIRQIASSIETFRFNVPVLIDANDKLIAGHGRIEAAKLLGLNEVPTICLEDLTPAQARAFTIADNRLTEISVRDDRLLSEQLRALSVLDLDFNLEGDWFHDGRDRSTYRAVGRHPASRTGCS